MATIKNFSLIEITTDWIGLRLDKALSLHEKISTRSRAEHLITNECVLVNGKNMKSSYAVKANDRIEISFPEIKTTELLPYALKLDILFEDKDLLVINKPPNLVVHPAAGHEQDTLVNALIYHTSDFNMKFGDQRPGIVHRLDQETSGLLVVAKNDETLEHLALQFKNRTTHRIYFAICMGKATHEKGTIKSYLARHPADRKRFASVRDDRGAKMTDIHKQPTVGKWAVTHYQLLSSMPSRDLHYISLKLETGRTHQIRVHLSEFGLPILGDKLYGDNRKVKHIKDPALSDLLNGAKRCALHAAELGFEHPRSKEKMFFKVDWPDYHELRKYFPLNKNNNLT